jgi:hypothetical protein
MAQESSHGGTPTKGKIMGMTEEAARYVWGGGA